VMGALSALSSSVMSPKLVVSLTIESDTKINP
jgi:hypothetical protein